MDGSAAEESNNRFKSALKSTGAWPGRVGGVRSGGPAEMSKVGLRAKPATHIGEQVTPTRMQVVSQLSKIAISVAYERWARYRFGTHTVVAQFCLPNQSHIDLFGSERPIFTDYSNWFANCIGLIRAVMDSLIMAAASGMRSRMESLDMLANNLANASSPGFKADREFYNLYVSADADGSDSQPATTAPVIEKQWTDFSQGTLTPTSNPLDVAITGKGFFAVNSPSGTLFTRDGSFQMSPQGELQTQEGYAVRDPEGKPIVLDASKRTEIGTDGTLRQDGVDVGQINLVDFSDSQALTKQGQNYFFANNGMTPLPASQAEVQQGRLESANFQTAESAVRLITVMRQFESLQKAMSVGTDMNKKAVEEVARVD